ncbi:hypothetical protein SAMN05192585_1672, partial [Acetanaerobacterium elongatum]
AIRKTLPAIFAYIHKTRRKRAGFVSNLTEVSLGFLLDIANQYFYVRIIENGADDLLNPFPFKVIQSAAYAWNGEFFDTKLYNLCFQIVQGSRERIVCWFLPIAFLSDKI